MSQEPILPAAVAEVLEANRLSGRILCKKSKRSDLLNVWRSRLASTKGKLGEFTDNKTRQLVDFLESGSSSDLTGYIVVEAKMVILWDEELGKAILSGRMGDPEAPS